MAIYWPVRSHQAILKYGVGWFRLTARTLLWVVLKVTKKMVNITATN